MTAILSLLLVVTLSILVTRIAAIALRHTGLARQSARFQARSAFSGAGFTTAESEQVVNHPVRRRIVLTLMLLGNAGIVTAVSSLMLAFVGGGNAEGMALWIKVVLLVTGLVLLWAFASSQWVDRLLSRIVDRALSRFTRLDVSDYEGLLHLAGDYKIVELAVEDGSWLDGQPLRALRPAEEGVMVLGIAKPNGEWLGTPGGDTVARSGDRLIVYGRTEAIRELEERRAGDDRAHAEAVDEQRRVAEAERRSAERNGTEDRMGSHGASRD
ncbi:TrkA-C domain protein [Thiorhodococcus drewsii AZ1]|uniref:TrkA-C domain protein n=1 Tax=Thiorhodococcus drewsii AZ1 TaxID=765913 RepID=G2E299_9GAMM|nr:TrkA C-terminal domain-containing protein [Thiorhodococcus drewsii]EGV30815.1 TrkA-C domain protein [Thiorhodococcus drewsii AZ1]